MELHVNHILHHLHPVIYTSSNYVSYASLLVLEHPCPVMSIFFQLLLQCEHHLSVILHQLQHIARTKNAEDLQLGCLQK